MDLNNEEMARAFWMNEVRASIRDIRTTFFQIIDSLRMDDLDNLEQLISILKDEDLARKFSLFNENRSKGVRKAILDTTNSCERQLTEYIENFDIAFKKDVELQGLFKR